MLFEINGTPPEEFNAYLLDFNVGSPGPNVDYFASKTTLFFTLFKTAEALRTITLKLEFMSDDEFSVVSSMSDFTAFVTKKADMKLPDGYCYRCILKKVGSPKRVFEQIYSVSFTFIGYRHKEKETVSFPGTVSTVSFAAKGNYMSDCKLNFKLTASNATIAITCSEFSDEFTVSGSAGDIVTIDGISKKVHNEEVANIYGDCDFYNFPRISPGKVQISCTGVSDLCISYLPVCW